MKKQLGYYMQLAYTIIMRRDDDGDLVARIEELPGCAAHGATPSEALDNLKEAQELWITDCIEAGQPVPEPEAEQALPSGKWVQRVPRTLHQKLVHLARREGVSLNQFVTSILSEAVGTRAKAGNWFGAAGERGAAAPPRRAERREAVRRKA